MFDVPAAAQGLEIFGRRNVIHQRRLRNILGDIIGLAPIVWKDSGRVIHR